MDPLYNPGATIGGAIVIGAFCIFGLILALQIIFYERNRRKLQNMLDEGYYFVEDAFMWKRYRTYLRGVHPNNVDLTGEIPRIINPALLID